MSDDVRALAEAILHEGYLLYPYQPSALKNLHRYPFGTLYPESFCRVHEAGDTSHARLECVICGPLHAHVSVQVSFLQLQDGEALVREVSAPQATLASLAAHDAQTTFCFDAVSGELSIRVADLGRECWKLSVDIRNRARFDAPEARSRDDALTRALCSAHLLLRSARAEFVSAIDPPEGLRALVESCRSTGLWPVLLGQPGTRDTLLAAPIILYDYPELAPESPGDFFDATEIEALLTLRVLTLTEEEKRAMAEGDPRARELLARTEAEGLARLGQLHGRLCPRPAFVRGDRVRLRPKGRADIFDLALDGQAATVESIERDLEGRTYVVVTVDDDPGKDLGAYAHRFFFRPEELEPR